MKINFETVNCDLCNSHDYELIASQTDLLHKRTKRIFNVVSCKKCGLKFTNPRPTKKSISNFYISEYSYHQKISKYKLTLRKFISKLVELKFVSFLSFIFPNKLNQLLISYIKPKIKDPVLLFIDTYSKKKKINFIDVGCGSGFNVHFWGDSSSIRNLSTKINVYGIEPSISGRKILVNDKFKVFESIDKVPNNKKFEIIRFNWSLEHVHKPKLYFQFIKNHLSKDGIAIICVPNINGFINKIDKNCLELPIHLFHFDKYSLNKYAKLNNLELKYFRTFSYPGMYSYAKKIGALKSDYKFDQITLFEAINFMKIHKEIDRSEMGNDLIGIFKHK